MIKKISTIFLIFLLTGCSGIGTTRIKNLIDFTPKLEVESPKSNLFYSGIVNPLNNDKLKSYKSSRREIIASPAIAKKVVYNIDVKGNVTAFSLEEKKILWTKNIVDRKTDNKFSAGGILFSDGKLYITYNTRSLVVLNAANGYEVIRKKFPDILRSKPVMVDDELIIVQTVSNQILAYNIKNSKIMWIHEGGSEIISAKNHAHPVVHNGNVLASYSSGEVIYLRAKDGANLWVYNIDDNQEIGLPNFAPEVIVTKPIFVDNYVYFATSNGKIVKLDVRDGSEIWVKNAADIQSMIFHDNNLIVTSNAREVAILSTIDGKTYWAGELISEKERNAKRPKAVTFLDPFVVKDGAVYIVHVIDSDGNLYKFKTDETGQLPVNPEILSIARDVRDYWISCCDGSIYLMLSNSIKF